MVIVYVGLLLIIKPPVRATACTTNVQVWVQPSQAGGWTQNLTLNPGQSFWVGTFENGVQVIDNTSMVRVLYPDGMVNVFSNGDRVEANMSGNYEVSTAANDPLRNSCAANGQPAVTVMVTGGNVAAPTPFPVTTPANAYTSNCAFNSTQARVQEDVNHAWNNSVNINQGGWFNVGSFHNGTGQFTNNSMMTVYGPTGYMGTFNNGERIWAKDPGTYTVYVWTPNQSGAACQDQATVHVQAVSAAAPAAVGPNPVVYAVPSPVPTTVPVQPYVQPAGQNRDSLVVQLIRWIVNHENSPLINKWLSEIGIESTAATTTTTVDP